MKVQNYSKWLVNLFFVEDNKPFFRNKTI